MDSCALQGGDDEMISAFDLDALARRVNRSVRKTTYLLLTTYTLCCLRGQDESSAVCTSCRSTKCPVECEVSEDAGRYLCEFVYFKSLHSCPTAAAKEDNKKSRGRALFVHVPGEEDLVLMLQNVHVKVNTEVVVAQNIKRSRCA